MQPTSYSQSQLESHSIPVIPDIEDLQDDPTMDDIIDAHQEYANRNTTHNALNTDMLKESDIISFIDDIELSILARCLLKERELVELDEIWTWDKLFTEVSGDIHEEKPKSADPITKVG